MRAMVVLSGATIPSRVGYCRTLRRIKKALMPRATLPEIRISGGFLTPCNCTQLQHFNQSPRKRRPFPIHQQPCARTWNGSAMPGLTARPSGAPPTRRRPANKHGAVVSRDAAQGRHQPALAVSLGAWGEQLSPEPQNREWARLAAGGAALHGGFYPKSGYHAALQRMKRRAKSRLPRCKRKIVGGALWWPAFNLSFLRCARNIYECGRGPQCKTPPAGAPGTPGAA
jgi:hypothetical protein